MTQQKTLKEKISIFLAGDYHVLENIDVVEALPSIIVNILEKNRLVERLIAGLACGMSSNEASVRQQCGSCLAETAKLLEEKEIRPLLEKLNISLNDIAGNFHNGSTENIGKTGAKVIAANPGERKPIPRKTEQKNDSVANREQQIFLLHHNGSTDEAKRQIVDLIASCAVNKDFKNADRLRERIYELDPMALTEIVRTGEIIEEEKSGAIDSGLLETWSNLLNVLSPDEFNSLYFMMENRELEDGETLVPQGTGNDELFFINSGSVRISYFQTGTGGDREIFLENLENGQIGAENFFNASLWTVSLTAVQKTQISILRRDDLPLLEERNPGIVSKLREYSSRFINIAELLSRKGLDRRIYERYKVRRTVHFDITGKSGGVSSSFNGAMADISQGGFCFLVRIINKENSRFLLGRNIRVTIPLTQGGEQEVEGTIIGVELRDGVHGQFSGHVKFINILERQTLKCIIE